MDVLLRDEATELLRDLIRIDTTNPPGRETAAATFLARYLEAEGIACELVARDPERANLVARLPGSGDGPSLALLGHTDVVFAEADDWSVDPFAGELRDGFVWGRGALDMKQHTAANAVAFATLARSGFRPRGDLVLIAEADEEDGAARVGLQWLVEARPDIRTDYALNEGGGERLELADGRVAYLLSCAEKASVPLRVRVRGVGGHAALPSRDNALLKLGPVLDRLAALVPSERVEPELAALLDELVPGDDALPLRLARARALHPVLADDLPAMLSSTFAPTMASASAKRNVVPARAEVICDCRALPGTDPDEVRAELAQALDGLDVEVEPHEPPEGGTRSPLGTPLEDVCRSFVMRLEPGAVVVPAMSTGFTNSHYLREAFGTVAYGFLPQRHTDPKLAADVVHAADERVHQDDVGVAVDFLVHAARTIGGLSA